MTDRIERELGGIKVNLENINKNIVDLRNEMPCRNLDPNINPQERISKLETNQKEMKSRMGIVEKLAGGLVLVFAAIAAWFKATGGKTL